MYVQMLDIYQNIETEECCYLNLQGTVHTHTIKVMW